jgi:hypothetical protein
MTTDIKIRSPIYTTAKAEVTVAPQLNQGQ